MGFKVLVIGDCSSRPGQMMVAKAKGNYIEDNPDIEYIVFTGDNIYPNGVRSPTSPRFDDSWREVYLVPQYPEMASKNWYISLGNHDHTDNLDELHQV